jgi:hypothetical protein
MNTKRPTYAELALLKINPHPEIPYIHGTVLGVVHSSHIDTNKYFEIEYPLVVDNLKSVNDVQKNVSYHIANVEWSQLQEFTPIDDLSPYVAYYWVRGANAFINSLCSSKGSYKFDKWDLLNGQHHKLFPDEYVESTLEQTMNFIRMGRVVNTFYEWKELYYPNKESIPKPSAIFG